MFKRRTRIAIGALSAMFVAGAMLIEPAAAQDSAAETVQVNLDNVFVLLAAVLVIFMQAGFALVEAGLTRAKSVANIMMKNLMDFCAGVIAFFCVGYAFAFGEGNGFIGWKGFFLGEGAFAIGTLTVPVSFLFQVAFAATAATIVSGAMAERTKFKSYFVYSVIITAFIYPVVVHWQWGGGWLSTMSTPFHDFAGSTIVHMTGGIAALMGAIVIGPRHGRYGPEGRPIPAHSVPFAVLGTFILLVGWYGFNAGSELAADEFIGGIAVTTTIAAAAGAITAMLTIWAKTGKPDVTMAANGMLAGLVGITAGCAAVSNIGALAIGAIAGVIVVGSVFFFDRVKVDDPVGAISVHGVCGAWGTIAVGLFATENSDFWKQGLFYGGGANQLVAQLIGVGAVAAFVAVTTGLMFLGIKATIGLRVSLEEEIAGLDVEEHGSPGYGPDFVNLSTSGSAVSVTVPPSREAAMSR
jgi:Amt family ammonium transporter